MLIVFEQTASRPAWPEQNEGKGRAVDVVGKEGVGVAKLLEEHFSKAFRDR